MKIIKQSVSLEWATEDALKVIERAGRVCYKSEEKITEDSAKEFIKRAIKNEHYAILEHACASFRIITDRGISHEIVRHRIASYCQESTRYCSYDKEKFGNQITVIEPDLETNSYGLWYISCKNCEENYFNMLNRGCSPQIARSVLPTCLKTELIMTANFREWRHFLSLRLSKAAHPQIREISKMIYEVLIKDFEVVFSDLEF